MEMIATWFGWRLIPREEPISTECNGADRILNRVIVDRESAVRGVAT